MNKPLRKKIHIFGGGTVQHVATHFAFCAPAYGTAAKQLAGLYREMAPEMEVVLHLTKMADPSSSLETNEDVESLVDKLVEDPDTKIIVFSVAMCDFKPDSTSESRFEFGKYAQRLRSKWADPSVPGGTLEIGLRPLGLRLRATEKVIQKIRQTRKDIFLIGFKTTQGADTQEQFRNGLRLMKEASCNLVLANDTGTRNNIIITPEETWYHETGTGRTRAEGLSQEEWAQKCLSVRQHMTPEERKRADALSRAEVMKNLVDMSLLRSRLTFTRSTVVEADPIPWDSELVPMSLRMVVDFCIKKGAYKTGPTGATVGHFACKIGPTTFLTSRRKTNFNDMANVGLVKVETDGPDTVIAYGSKPSVGGQSQRIIFSEHEGMDCVVHAHVPLKPDAADDVPVVSQREYECGSHQCGQNTSNGLKQFGNLKAVMLDKHGPNIIFNRDINPVEVIQFIERNFDLSEKT